MAGSHVWVTHFSIVRAHPESGYVYQRYPGTGFRFCNPGARYPYTPSPGVSGLLPMSLRASDTVNTLDKPDVPVLQEGFEKDV
jgi:hypothetical protein